MAVVADIHAKGAEHVWVLDEHVRVDPSHRAAGGQDSLVSSLDASMLPVCMLYYDTNMYKWTQVIEPQMDGTFW